MRPEAWKELLWNGFSFISERLLHHAPTDDAAEARQTASQASAQNSLTVDRLKPPVSSTKDASPAPFQNEDYELIWRDGPYEYVTPAGFESVASLLRAWKDDVEAGNITRCHYPDAIIRRFDDTGNHKETRLSAVVHNFMLERYGHNTEQAWQEAVVEFLKVIEATERWIAVFYAPENFETMKVQGVVPYEELSTLAQQLWDGSCGLCAVGDFLAFTILQTHQWGHPGMHTCQEALMKMLVDLEAFHRQQPILSFVLAEKVNRHPGYLFDDKDGVVESVRAEKLRDLWLLGGDVKAGTTRRPGQLLRVCRVYGASASGQQSQEALRRARIISAAAASIKKARRSAGGSRALLIPPSQPLLYERYRTTSDAGLKFNRYDALSAIKDYRIPAKRKAKPATPDPRLSKRGRVDEDKGSELKKIEATEAEAEAAAAAAAAAASIPLPPSPAATETSDEETDIATAALEALQQQRRLPWAAVFPEDDDFAAPRLRISAAKAEELRLLAEHKRATQEAARLKREAELRRKEEERRRKEEEELAKSSGLRPPMRQVIVALSQSWHSRVNSAVRADPSKDVAKSPEGTALKSKDFRTVVPKSEWLNDEIVNGFLLHLANYINANAGITNPKTQTPKCHAFTSFFWKPLSTKGAAGTERWMKRVGVTKDNFLMIETILIPICESSHWTLVVVRPGRTTVTHMDSLGSNGAGRRAVTDTVMRWVKDLLKDRFSDKWRVQHYDSPRQTNGWDCGVHTVTNALFVSLGLDPSFYGAVEMPLQRDRIAATLINGGFSGDLDLAGL